MQLQILVHLNEHLWRKVFKFARKNLNNALLFIVKFSGVVKAYFQSLYKMFHIQTYAENDPLIHVLLEAIGCSLHAHLFRKGADGCHSCSIHLHLLGTSNLANLHVINLLI